MQTFLPLPDFALSAQVLDDKRLFNQINEACVIFKASLWLYAGNNDKGTRRTPPWGNHSAVRMWRGYAPALASYWNVMIGEYLRRGGTANVPRPPVIKDRIEMPMWFGGMRLHSSHRTNLLRKDPEHYGQFGWSEIPSNGYVWGERGWDKGYELNSYD